MKLLHIHLGLEGGAEKFFVRLARAMDARGVRQAAIIRPGRSWRPELPASMRVEEGSYLRWWITRFTMKARVRRMLREFEPDGILAWMPRAAEILPAGSSCLRATRLGDYPAPGSFWKFRNADVLVCNTPDVAAWVARHGWGGGVEVISNFVESHAATPEPRSRHATPPGEFLVVAVGRLVELKGYHVLIEALARTEGVHVWIVGEGEERPRLEALAASLGVGDRLRLLGWRTDPAPCLAAADALCLPSLHETLGNAVLEGWAAGLPVVASRAPGPSWLIRDGENGLLADVGDSAGLADALMRLRDDAQLRRRLADRAASDLAARFSERAVVDAYLRLFAPGRPSNEVDNPRSSP